jgi:hypothetical protein
VHGGANVLLPERMGCRDPLSDGRFSDGRDERSAPTQDRGHDDPRSVTGDAAILPPRRLEVQPVSWTIAGQADPRRRARLSGSPGVDSRVLGISGPDRLRPAFFFGVTPGEAAIPERIPYAREPRKLPTVLSADEIARFLESVSSLKSRIALTTARAAGSRVSEVVALKLRDSDSHRIVMNMPILSAYRILSTGFTMAGHHLNRARRSTPEAP